MAVDLHVHSTCSDGTLTPVQVVRAAASKGLSALALADHDTVAGVLPALRIAARHGLDLFPAVEVSAQHGPQELHILGFLIDLDEPELAGALVRVREGREDRLERIVSRLNSLDVPITLEQVREIAGEGSVGRPHVAAALVRMGAVSSPQQAFQLYLRRGRPAYVDRYRLGVEDAIRLIRNAGGLPVLAHPGLGCPDGVIRHLVTLGLGGLEAYHVDHRAAQTQHYLRMAESMDLIVTGGSDSHGPEGPAPVEIGQVYVPDSCADAVRDWGRANGRWPLPPLPDTEEEEP